MAWLATWLSNPLMLGVGALAVLSPIIIHLLNKRRFKIVNWAAMDFLFDADKKNRRRVKLENFLLLLLRCLAMFLLGLLLAKPFLPAGSFGGESQQFQRIILLDDSLSQRIKVGNQTAYEVAKDRLKQLLKKLAVDGGNDFLTLYITSSPDEPVGGLANEPITVDSLDAVMSRIDELKCSDQVADYTQALLKINEFVESDRAARNQVVYVMTDMRRRDWKDVASDDAETTPAKLIEKISQATPNTFVVDVGSTLEENLAVTEVRAQDILVAGAIIRFSVSVTNFGETTAENVDLRFRVDDYQPQIETIATVAPGKTETVTFRYMFQHDSQEFNSLEFEDKLQDITVNSRIQVEIVQNSANGDSLTEDSEGFFAAQTLKGIPVLIVDGDASSVPERSESFYLQTLGLPGTGILVDTRTVGELETISLTKYKVIFICNIDEASAARIEALRQWVIDGGGLIFMPGDRVRASTFNKSFYQSADGIDGEGLSPMKLEVMEGDVSRSSWIYMQIKDAAHPALKVALDEEIGFQNSEIFSWWRGSVKPALDGTLVSTPLLLGNEDRTPAMADRTLGKGRTVTFAFSGDADWTMWPGDPTYVCVLWDLVNDLVGNRTEATSFQVGSSIKKLVDLSQYGLKVALIDPSDEKTEANARPVGDESEDNVLYEAEFPSIKKRGFYELEFRRENEDTVRQLYAVNIDPGESDLRRLDVSSLPDDFFGGIAKLVSGDDLVTQDESGANNDIWPQILMLLAAVLIGEQFFGWWFGRKR